MHRIHISILDYLVFCEREDDFLLADDDSAFVSTGTEASLPLSSSLENSINGIN